MSEFIKTHYRPLGMILLIIAGYLVKKFAPLAGDELALLDALWVVLGFGAVFTPNFSQSKAAKAPE